jgi:hypothetical protein
MWPCSLSFGKSILCTKATDCRPPEVRGPFTLTAAYDPAAGHNAFSYNGKTIPPVIRVEPGKVIRLHYVRMHKTAPRSTLQSGSIP